MVSSTASQASIEPQRRVVILGASNVALGLSTVVETACLTWGRPLEVLAASGHGRSYGMTSRMLGRSLPGIAQCGLWDALQQRPPLPTAALVTDIGNDIFYGCTPQMVCRWVDHCLERLAGIVQRLVITRLPLSAIAELPPWKMRLLASLIFPSSRLDYQRAFQHAIDLDAQLLQYANRFGAYVVQPDHAWYHWDPIHIARRHRQEAWLKYMTCWADGRSPRPASSSWRRWFALQRTRPLMWHRFGRAHHRQQPAVQLGDGTTISLF